MKKLFSALVAVLFAAPSFAQFSSGGFSLSEENVYYGIRLGVTGASISGETAGELNNDYGSMAAGMTLAGVVGLRVADSTPLFLESGLYYTERGGKKNNTTVNLNYLEIPILIKYGIQSGDDLAFLPFIGPYFSYAISGKTVFKDNGVAEKHSSFNSNNFKHGEMGFKLGCGVEYNQLYLEVGYQLGVTNISKNDALTAHGRALFANFGINF